MEQIASQVDFVFCAVNMPKNEIKAMEEAYAKAECPVVSNNSANRFTSDVPMVVPEINAGHIDIIPAQRAAGWAPSAASSRSSPTAACKLCARLPSPDERFRGHQGPGVHLPGHLGRRQDL